MLELNLLQNSIALGISIETYARILEMAVEQINQDLPETKLALSQQRTDQAQGLSHRWKGDLANLRLDEIAAIAHSLNVAIKTSAPTKEQQQHFENFASRFHEIRIFLQTNKPQQP